MYIKSLAFLTLVGFASANPVPQVFSFDDVLLPREDGSVVVMKKWDYEIQEARANLQRRKDIVTRRSESPSESPVPETDNLDKRCESSYEVQVLSDTNFKDWDVAMSPVVANTGSVNALIAVSKGYSIETSITVTESNEVTFMKDVFAASLSIALGMSWTTTDTLTYTFYVPPGQYGVVISNPWARRIEGNYISGCTATPDSKAFSSTSYTSEGIGGLSWVTGPIILCNSTQYPIPYCVGTGVHK